MVVVNEVCIRYARFRGNGQRIKLKVCHKCTRIDKYGEIHDSLNVEHANEMGVILSSAYFFALRLFYKKFLPSNFFPSFFLHFEKKKN